MLFSWRTLIGAVFVWVAATLGVVYARLTPPRLIVTSGLVIVAWVGVGVVVAWRWHRRRVDAQYAPFLAGLVGSGILAVALAAVQVLPVLEFARQSRRVSGERGINSYNFSLDPFRVVELVWPNLFGTNSPENRSWIQAVPPAGDHQLWIDSLYLGGLPLVLALAHPD